MKYLETDLNIEQSDQPILQIILNIGPWWFGDVWNPRSNVQLSLFLSAYDISVTQPNEKIIPKPIVI